MRADHGPGALEIYNRLYAAQNGRCAICGRAALRLHLDHDHRTGAKRALLCGSCNRGIGYLGDDPDLLEAAAAYLREHRRLDYTLQRANT